jgi:hypothetical protein
MRFSTPTLSQCCEEPNILQRKKQRCCVFDSGYQKIGMLTPKQASKIMIHPVGSTIVCRCKHTCGELTINPIFQRTTVDL